MTAEQLSREDVEFWPLDVVMRKVGLSRSEIYRRAKIGQFPACRAYRESARRFWLSSDVRRWQQDELSGIPLAADEEALIG